MTPHENVQEPDPGNRPSSALRSTGEVLLLILYLPVMVVLTVAGLCWHLVLGAVLRAWFWENHRTHGRFIVFIYSESPHWQAYVEEHILPRIESRAVVLNWSQRASWPQEFPWESRIFRHWAGGREFNPAAIVFDGYWNVSTIRFYLAFRDFKHGHSQMLREAEQQLFEAAGSKFDASL